MANTATTRVAPRSTNKATTSTSNRNSATKSADKKIELDVEIISIEPEYREYTRKDGSTMERQQGVGYCPALKSDVIITRSIVDQDGNDKTLIDDSHIGQSFSCLVSKVPAKNGKGFLFFAEVSLSRIQLASDESVNLFDSYK